MNFQSQIGIR